MKYFHIFLVCAFLCCHPSYAQREAVKTSTDILCFLPSATALTMVLLDRDKEGFKQLFLSSATSTAVSCALKLCIKKDRPDGDGNHSMPSTHTMAAFSGASFVQRRYGWKWGIPAYAISTYVAWGRVYCKRHDVWDVLAGAAIGVGGTYIFTRPKMKDKNVAISPFATENGGGMQFAMTF